MGVEHVAITARRTSETGRHDCLMIDDRRQTGPTVLIAPDVRAWNGGGHNTSGYQQARRAQSPGRISGSPVSTLGTDYLLFTLGADYLSTPERISWLPKHAPRLARPVLPPGTSGNPYLWYAPRQSCCRTRLESIEEDWNAQTLARSREKTYTRTVVAERLVRGERRGFESVVVGEKELFIR
ncbi:hypothetical protein DFH11DRAFT_1545342 [Phellopilus nigrolimitatus]|nr:hypothetical protein DFH11DRAFT_1545342 [Phellopilus nigrolimitatus]